MSNRVLILLLAASFAGHAEIQSGPPLPYHVVEGWAHLPAGWNFGEVASVDVDKNDNVWVFNRGPHPVVEFDSSGKFLRAWTEVRS